MNLNKVINYINKQCLGKYRTDCSFKELTSLKIGGNIGLVYYPYTESGLTKVIDILDKESIKWIVIGNGTNLLCSDKYYDGVVISLKELRIRYYYVGDSLYCYAQEMLPSIGKRFINYYGFNRLKLIPGTIGGGIVTNCGCYDIEISEIVEKIYIYDKKVKIIENENIFSYRHCKLEDKLIIKVKMRLEKDNDKTNYSLIKKQTQKVEGFNAGSTFKNPKGKKAWKLIKDYAITRQVNDARISDYHNNFFINIKNASGEDMYKLIKKVQEEVYEKTAISLELEWKVINFD